MAAQKGDRILLVYRTNRWHDKDSRELVYVGTTICDCVDKLYDNRKCTSEQAGQLLGMHMQSQCTGNDYEWEIKKATIGTFIN